MKFRMLVLLIIPVFISSLQNVHAALPSKRKLEKEILEYTNRLRQQKGLAPLKLVNVISAEAEDHSADMAKHRVGFGHSGFNKRFSILRKKIPGSFLMAENVAYGPGSGREVVNMWKRSPQHRKNMLGDYKYIGIGIATNSSGVPYYTQIFIR